MDDLTRIRGIGPKTAATLRDAGIDGFARLAAVTYEELESAGLGAVDMGTLDGWKKQATEFAGADRSGDETEAPTPAPPAPAEIKPADEKPAGKKPAPKPVDLLIVTGPKRGRRRAGRSFGPSPVEVPVGELTDDELTAIINDPDLSCRGETRQVG